MRQNNPKEQTRLFLAKKLAYIGHFDCYERGRTMTEMFLGVKVSLSTIYRLMDKVDWVRGYRICTYKKE